MSLKELKEVAGRAAPTEAQLALKQVGGGDPAYPAREGEDEVEGADESRNQGGVVEDGISPLSLG